MPIQAVQRFIYNNFVQRPRVNRALDGFGNHLNLTLERLGVQKRYATGLTRNKAVLFASNNPVELQKARDELLATGKTRAKHAIFTSDIYRNISLQNAKEILIKYTSISYHEYGVLNPEKVIQAALEAGMTPGEVHFLFRKIDKAPGITERQRFFNALYAFQSLSAVIKTKVLSPKQIFALFRKFIHRSDSMFSFAHLPPALEKFKEIFTVEQTFALLAKITKKDKPAWYLEGLPKILDENRGIFTQEQSFRFLVSILQGTEEIREVEFSNIPIALDKAKEFISQEDALDLFEKTLAETKDWVGAASYALPAALESNLTPEQIPDFFKNIIKIITDSWDVYPGFKALPAALKAGLTSEQIFDLFKNVNKINRNQEDDRGIADCVFKVLPITLEAKLTPEWIIKLFNKNKADFKKLYFILKEVSSAGLNNDQKKGLLLGLVSIDWLAPDANESIYNTLIKYCPIGQPFLNIAKELGFKKQIALLLNNPATPEHIVKELISFVRKEVADSWSHLLKGRPPEELPRVFEFCTEVMAGKALFAYEKIKNISSQTKKPTITVYILSTAYKLNIENFAEQLKEEGLTPEETAKALDDFDRQVQEKVKAGLSQFEARMQVGQRWLSENRLSRFTQPEFLKIPSGSSPPEAVVKRLKELSRLAREHNWDMIYVDHSTVRSKDVVHRGDVEDFEKGRAIARALEIVDPNRTRRKWLFKVNDWQTPELDAYKPNMIGLNLYDGKIYESHAGGNKSDWLPVDDHGEFVGVSWDAEGRPHYTDYFVITQNGSGKYHVYMASEIFDKYLQLAIERHRGVKERINLSLHNILFVCNANHDRSPLAEHLMHKLVNERVVEPEQIRVASAGLITDDWLKTKGIKRQNPLAPSSGTRLLLEQKGIDYSSFRKQQVTRDMIKQADVIFVMTRREKEALIKRFPEAADKMQVLRQYAGYAEIDWDIPTPKTFNYQTAYLFEEALERALRRMAGENIPTVRRLPKSPFRGIPYREASAA